MHRLEKKYPTLFSCIQSICWCLKFFLFDILLWCFIIFLGYILLAFHALIFSLEIPYYSDESLVDSVKKVSILLFLGFPLVGLIGKIGILQYPFLLVSTIFLRLKAPDHKRLLFMLPVFCFLAGFVVTGIIQTATISPISTFYEWITLSDGLMKIFVVVSFFSTLVATIPWSFYLKKKFEKQEESSV